MLEMTRQFILWRGIWEKDGCHMEGLIICIDPSHQIGFQLVLNASSSNHHWKHLKKKLSKFILVEEQSKKMMLRSYITKGNQ